MPTFTPRRARCALTAAALGLVLTGGLAACGDDEPADAAPKRSVSEPGQADVDFATGMIPHHAQALSMVDMTRGRSLDPKVQRLVEDVRDAQAPEIETMTHWLTQWGEGVPATTPDHGHGQGDSASGSAEGMPGMDHDMPGMMSAEDMTTLETAKGAEFQDLWLEMMIDHHRGAVEMAETELDDGRYRPALELAQDIVDSQSEEITAMQNLIGS